MIIFDLRCRPNGHVFEAWFGSSEDYEAQRERGLVECPICSAGDIEKAPMAPRVSLVAGGEAETGDVARMKALLSEMAQLQRRMLEKSDFVGERFPEEARAIHLGEAEARAIHGRATREEAERLAEEGIPVSPLPFPVADPGEEN